MVDAVNVAGAVVAKFAATVTLVLAPNALEATTLFAGTEYAVPPTVIVAGFTFATR
jgi:hypothetical protein